MSRKLLGLLLVAVLLACKQTPARPDRREYRIFVEGAAETLKGVEMAGQPLQGGKPEARGMSYSLEVAAGEHVAERSFMVLIATSCGTEKIPATLAFGLARTTGVQGEDRERAETKPGQVVLTELEYEAPKQARVYLDSEGAGSAKVEIGTTPLSLAASEHDVVIGTCATARDVKIDGEIAGTVDVKTRIVTATSGKKLEVSGSTLVDPTGKHCYEVVTHVYTEKDVDRSKMARSAPKRLEGAKVYVQEIDDFMQESPEEMKSEDGWPMRHELRRCTNESSRRTH